MGRQRRDQGRLFYEFRLEDRIPENHLLRRMNVFVTAALTDLHKELKPHYSDIGRPSIDPELMIRMLIVGYCYGIRSERKLCDEVELHLAYRWFCKLDLDDNVPHHSTFSENRLGRFRDSDLLRHIFERVVWAAMAMGLVKSTRKDGTFSRFDFTFDKRRNLYICPASKTLTTTGRVAADNGIRYLAAVPDCRACPLKPKCCPGMPSRRIVRDFDEDARDVTRRKMKTKAFLQSRDLRKRVEMRFAHLKTHHRFERMRLRGLSGARDEFHLAAIVQNLKTLALRLIRPPPLAACV
jgi:transposase